MSESTVKVFCFGHFHVEKDGAALTEAAGAQAKPLALLKTLIALGGEHVPVEQLTEALWPDSDGDAAYSAFTSALHRLRGLLGNEALPIRQKSLSLDPREVWWDCREVTVLLGQAETAVNARNASPAGDAMERAIALYRGPFLEGEFDPPEILALRDKLHGRFLRALRETAGLLERNGGSERAVRLYEQGIEADPVAEELYQGLLRAYGRAGRKAEAEAAYQRLKRNLETQGGGKPSDETEGVRREAAESATAQSARTETPPATSPLPGEAPPVRQAVPAVFKSRRVAYAAVAATAAVAVALISLGVWGWIRPPGNIDAERASSPEEPPSIAVLPFTNMSGDPEQEYFADGISETLITILSKLPNLRVIARNSTFTYKGKAIDVRLVGRELGVRHVLEGSVQRSADRIRVSAQLIDAVSGKHLWAETYDRIFGDIFAVQDEITKKIVSQMDVKLATGEDAAAFEATTNNVKAYELFLKANRHWWRRTKEDHAQGRLLLEEALNIDSHYAAAYDLLGGIHMDEAYERWSASAERSFELGRQNFEKAIEVDPKFGSAYSDLGWYYWIPRHEFGKAEALMRRGIELAPGSANAHQNLASLLTWIGEPEGALVEWERVRKLSPVPTPYMHQNLGWANLVLGRHKEALENILKCRAAWPDDKACLRCQIIILAEMGRLDETHALVRQLLQEMPYFTVAWYRDNIFGSAKDESLRNRMLDGMRKAGVPEK